MGGESKRRRGSWLPINHAISTRTRECRSLKDLPQTLGSLALTSYTIAKKLAAHNHIVADLQIEYGAANIIPALTAFLKSLPRASYPQTVRQTAISQTSATFPDVRVIPAVASEQCSRGSPAFET